MTWIFDPLRPLSYDFIMADPPWDFAQWSNKGERKNAKQHYDCMSLEQIKELPVNYLARRDACLFLWATWPMLPQAMEVMAAWGFDYRTGGAWHRIPSAMCVRTLAPGLHREAAHLARTSELNRRANKGTLA